MMTTADDVLPEDLGGEVVQWMDRGPLRFGSADVPALAVAAFVAGVAAAVGGLLLYRYLEPRRDALPPWRWRRGMVH